MTTTNVLPFGDAKYYGLKDKISKWMKGSILHIMFVGQIKHFKQWSKNFSLDVIPLTREGFVNAKSLIEKHNEHKHFQSMFCILTHVYLRWSYVQKYW